MRHHSGDFCRENAGACLQRHCEQSEAIQSFNVGDSLDCFVANAPRNDDSCLKFESVVPAKQSATRDP